MENSKKLKIVGSILILVFVVGGVAFGMGGGSLKGQFSRASKEVRSVNLNQAVANENIYDIVENNRLIQTPKLSYEMEDFQSPCSQLKYKKGILINKFNAIEKALEKKFYERESEFYKAEKLKQDYEKIKIEEWDPYVAQMDAYLAEWNAIMEEIKAIEQKHSMTLKEAQELWDYIFNKLTWKYLDAKKNDPNSAETKKFKKEIDDAQAKYDAFAKDAKPILDKLKSPSDAGAKLKNEKGGAIKSKMQKILDKIKVSEGLYIDYTGQLTSMEDEMEVVQQEIDAIGGELKKCSAVPAQKENNQKEGKRNRKEHQGDASRRWLQEIGAMDRAMEEIDNSRDAVRLPVTESLLPSKVR